MPWSRQFSAPIVLKDGRVIGTLGDAREMMLAIPELHRHEAIWRAAADLLNEAAAFQDLVPDAEGQLLRALKAEGLLWAI
jgi:hypothetical protein